MVSASYCMHGFNQFRPLCCGFHLLSSLCTTQNPVTCQSLPWLHEHSKSEKAINKLKEGLEGRHRGFKFSITVKWEKFHWFTESFWHFRQKRFQKGGADIKHAKWVQFITKPPDRCYLTKKKSIKVYFKSTKIVFELWTVNCVNHFSCLNKSGTSKNGNFDTK